MKAFLEGESEQTCQIAFQEKSTTELLKTNENMENKLGLSCAKLRPAYAHLLTVASCWYTFVVANIAMLAFLFLVFTICEQDIGKI